MNIRLISVILALIYWCVLVSVIISWLEKSSLFFLLCEHFIFSHKYTTNSRKISWAFSGEAVCADLYLPLSSLCLVRTFFCWRWGSSKLSAANWNQTRGERNSNTCIQKSPDVKNMLTSGKVRVFWVNAQFKPEDKVVGKSGSPACRKREFRWNWEITNHYITRRSLKKATESSTFFSVRKWMAKMHTCVSFY